MPGAGGAAGLANSGHTLLRTVAVQAVVAVGVAWHVVARVGSLVARVIRATEAIIAIDERAGLTVEHRIAHFGAVAEQTVITQGLGGNVDTGIDRFVADVDRAINGIIAIDDGTCLASGDEVACLNAVAVLAIVTRHVIGHVSARVRRFIAGIDRAGNSVVAPDR